MFPLHSVCTVEFHTSLTSIYVHDRRNYTEIKVPLMLNYFTFHPIRTRILGITSEALLVILLEVNISISNLVRQDTRIFHRPPPVPVVSFWWAYTGRITRVFIIFATSLPVAAIM